MILQVQGEDLRCQDPYLVVFQPYRWGGHRQMFRQCEMHDASSQECSYDCICETGETRMTLRFQRLPGQLAEPQLRAVNIYSSGVIKETSAEPLSATREPFGNDRHAWTYHGIWYVCYTPTNLIVSSSQLEGHMVSTREFLQIGICLLIPSVLHCTSLSMLIHTSPQ